MQLTIRHRGNHAHSQFRSSKNRSSALFENKSGKEVFLKLKLVRKFGLAPKYNKILKPLAADAGRVYSKTISTIRKIRKNKGIWLNKNQIAKIARCWQTDLHSQTVQGCFESYFNSLNSFFKRLEKGQAARPPYRTKKYFKLIFKQTAFRIKDDNILELSLRRGLPRLKIKLGKEASDFVRGSQTTYIELIWNKRRQAYDLCVVYPVEKKGGLAA